MPCVLMGLYKRKWFGRGFFTSFFGIGSVVSGWDDSLLSNNHSSDLKNPHSCCKSFELEVATRSMPLELFLKVVGSDQKLEDINKEWSSGLLLRDLPMEKYKGLMDIGATGRLSWLIDILRRLKV